MPRKDSLITHCMARAFIADEGGEEAVRGKWGEEPGEALAAQSRLKQWKLQLRVAPKAARTAGFIIAWAWAMKAEGKDSYSITEYQRFYHEAERQAYRSQSEFRELFPEFETPNEIATQLVGRLDARPSRGAPPVWIPVVL